MRRHSGYFVGCCGAVFAIASFLIGLEVSATTAAPSVDRGAPTVNRTLKSDRMPLIPGKSRNAVNGPLEIKAPPICPARIARWMRAGRQLDRTVAAGSDPGALRVLSASESRSHTRGSHVDS